MKDDIKITGNASIRRPEWHFQSGHGWQEGGVERVVAVRFGPQETVLAKARSPNLPNAPTTLNVLLVIHGQLRIATKELSEPLPYLTEASLVQHWGRMVTAAQEWDGSC